MDGSDISVRGQGAISSPPHGTVSSLRGASDSDEVFYSFTSFTQPPSVYCYNANSDHQELWSQNQVPFDASSIEVKQIRYSAKDETQIPMFLVYQKEQGHAGPMPTFLTGYGGFGVSLTPKFMAYATFLVEHGCLLAIPNLRGGSEFGEEWHLASNRRNLQTAFDDFIAPAKWLLEQASHA